MHNSTKTDLAYYAHNVSHRSTENFLLHTHETYEIFYFVSGDADYLIEGQEIHLRPHTLLTIAPNLFHGVRVHTNATYERHTLHFEPDLLGVERWSLLLHAFPYANRSRGRFSFRCLEDMEHSGVLNMLYAIEACAQKDEPSRKILMATLTESILTLLLLCAPPVGGEVPQENGRVSRTQREIIEYLNAHFSESITLDTLSEKFFISKHYLNRVFRKATGTTVMDYLSHKRVTYVQQLLINGIPAVQAASMAGFGDYTSFYRAYVKRFGHAPSHDRSVKPEAIGGDIFRMKGILRGYNENDELGAATDSDRDDGASDARRQFWQRRMDELHEAEN